MVAAVAFAAAFFELKPFNHIRDCEQQCTDTTDPTACTVFCDCIHNEGQPLDECLDAYYADR